MRTTIIVALCLCLSSVESEAVPILYQVIPGSPFAGGGGGGGGGTPGGSNTQVQFNDGGVFAGDTALVWNKTTNFLTVAGSGLANRTITASAGGAVTNGDGIAANPTTGPDLASTPQYSSGTPSPPATCNVGEVYAETDQLRGCICTASNTWTCNGKLRNHATDCTALTDGLVNELCFEADVNTLYVCEPSAGNCDTAGEWTAISSGGVSGLTATRVPFAQDATTLVDDADMVFATDTLTVTKAVFPTSATINADGVVVIGTNGGNISQQTAGVPDQSGLWTGSTSNAWLIAEVADKGFNFAHAATTDPTLFIHSNAQSTTRFMALSHNEARNSSIWNTGGSSSYFQGSGVDQLRISSDDFRWRSGALLGWSSSTDVDLAADTSWQRQAAAVIQQGQDAGTATAQRYKGPDSTTSGVAGAVLRLDGGDGTVGNANGGDLQLNGGAKAGTGVVGAVSIGGAVTGTNLKIDRTVTAGGTTGAQTINKIGGTVNLAAAATTLVVTDSLVDANSIVFCTRRTNDTTCLLASCESTSGSFTIRMTAACTGETSVGFLVTN